MLLLCVLLAVGGLQQGVATFRAPSQHAGHETRLGFHNEWTAVVEGDMADPRQVARDIGLVYRGTVPGMRRIHRFSRDGYPTMSSDADHDINERLSRHPNVEWSEQQFAKHRSKRQIGYTRTYNDPHWSNQWYLRGLVRDHDRHGAVDMGMHIAPLMHAGLTGKGVKVIIIDDGLEHTNRDIKHAYDASLGYDVVGDDLNPEPNYTDYTHCGHGTQCAGIIAMLPNNNFCGVGIAPGITLGGVRLLEDTITDRREAEAMGVFRDRADIVSLSWGPTDDGTVADHPGALLEAVLEEGVTYGRSGRGVVYVWANGNGGRDNDNCAYDGYTSSPFTLSVGNVDDRGIMPDYGESCASTHTVVYTRGGLSGVVTTGLNDSCSNYFSGTSAAAPIAAGVLALLLELNPEMTWLDIQHLVAYTSRPEPVIHNGDWIRNAAGLLYNTKVGFGLMDAEALMKETLRWNSTFKRDVISTECITHGDKKRIWIASGQPVTVQFSTDCRDDKNIRHLEHAMVFLDVDYTRRGALKFTLTSPQGTIVPVMNARTNDDSTSGLHGFYVTSVATWGEDPTGVWKIYISDDTGEDNSGLVGQLILLLYGTETAAHSLTAQYSQLDTRAVSQLSLTSARQQLGGTLGEPPVRRQTEEDQKTVDDLTSLGRQIVNDLISPDRALRYERWRLLAGRDKPSRTLMTDRASLESEYDQQLRRDKRPEML